MSRYIDTKWLEDNAKEYSLGYYDYDEYAVPLSAVEDAPSIDIVRCSECVYCNVQNTKYLYAICEIHGIAFKPFEDDTRTHGCAWGVTADRKTENSSEKPNNSTISKMEQVGKE